MATWFSAQFCDVTSLRVCSGGKEPSLLGFGSVWVRFGLSSLQAQKNLGSVLCGLVLSELGLRITFDSFH